MTRAVPKIRIDDLDKAVATWDGHRWVSSYLNFEHTGAMVEMTYMWYLDRATPRTVRGAMARCLDD